MPRSKFGTKSAGKHVHTLSVRQNDGDHDKPGNEVTTHNKYWNTRPGDKSGMLPAGEHTHEITGGDAETRPMNIAVYWIIKFK
jgi:hypothetical protein